VIEVVDGRFQTLVTDLGRFGYYYLGLPSDGPMDNFSFRVGNILLGNDENAAALECAFAIPTLKVMDDTCVVFTGAEVGPTINGDLVPMWQVYRVKKGEVISQGIVKSGCRAYVCFSGGIDVPLDYGSRSTNLPSGVGGYEGRALREGDVLRLLPPTTHWAKVVDRRLEDKYIPRFGSSYELRVIPDGMIHEIDNFDEFCEVTWKVSTYFCRTAYRLLSAGFEYAWARKRAGVPQPFGAGQEPGNAHVNVYPVGSVQVNVGNEAILVLQDAVTAGGYVTICTVIETDQDIIGQGKTGDEIKFVPVRMRDALRIRNERCRALNRIRESFLGL